MFGMGKPPEFWNTVRPIKLMKGDREVTLCVWVHACVSPLVSPLGQRGTERVLRLHHYCRTLSFRVLWQPASFYFYFFYKRECLIGSGTLQRQWVPPPQAGHSRSCTPGSSLASMAGLSVGCNVPLFGNLQ